MWEHVARRGWTIALQGREVNSGAARPEACDRQGQLGGVSFVLMDSIKLLAAVVLLSAASAGLAQQQINDPDFAAKVASPAFTTKHPHVGIDEAHRNFHTRDGRYKPFAELMEADGFAVSAAPPFSPRSLRGLSILVIANAMGDFLDSSTGAVRKGQMGPAFMPSECEAVRRWVRDGGSLLLIADHVPWGDASAILARRFGIEMGLGIVMDLKHADGNPTRLIYSVENGLLGDHPILRGRNSGERVRRVLAFTGQSLSVPATATALLKISNDATESFDPEDQRKIEAGIPAGTKVDGRAQGIAMPFGKGRVAVFGEAAMFSAQVATLEGKSFRVGMNVPGNDDRQFALNVMHWLAHLIN